ncbi:MAG: PKD domain-containing protein [Flavobacteriales bacterium]
MSKLIRLTLMFAVAVAMGQQASAQIIFTDPFTGLPTNSYVLDTICQGQSVDHCFNVTGGTNHTITSYINSDGAIIIAPPSNPFPRCFRYTASFSFTGADAITFTVTNNLGQTANCTVTIVVVNPNAPVNAGPDQQLCSPVNSTTLNAVTPDPLATGYWTKLTGPGTISGGTDSPAIAGVDDDGGPTVNVSGLQLGSNIFIWHQDYPCDQNIDVVTIYVYNGTPPIADANICYPSVSNHAAETVNLCGTNTYTLCANNPGTAATGTWTIFCGSGTIFNINNPAAQISNLGNGCNCLEWNIGNGPCPGGETKDSLYICVYPVVQTAVAPVDQTRCLGSFNTVSLVGNALSGANTALWTQISGPTTVTINSPATSTTTVGGAGQWATGIYTFNYLITSGPCGTSNDQVQVFVYNPSITINAGTDQTICLPNNSTTLAATAVPSPGFGTWSVISGTGAFSPNANTANATVSGLSVGLNRFRWTVSNGNCANNNAFDEVDITVFPANQPAANAGPDQNLTYSGTALTTTISANAPTPPGTGLWTISPATATIAPASNPNATVSNLTPGIYTLTWCLSNGSCDPAVCDDMIITVNNCQVTTTNAGPDQSFCTPANSATMAASAAPTPAIGTWTTIQGGGSIQSINSPTTLITNIPAGVNIYRWTVNNGLCGTFFDEVTVNIFDANSTTALAGPDQEFCAGGPPIVVNMGANTPVPPATGTWTGPGTYTPNNPTTAVTGLPVGTHLFTWTINNGPCGSSSDQMTVLIYAPGQTTATANSSEPQICTTNPNVVLTGNSLVNPATGQWTIIQGGGLLSNPTSQVTNLSGIPVGITCVEWRIDNGPCATPVTLADTVCISVFDAAQADADAGPDLEICSNIATINLAGNSIIFPAVGTWTVSPVGPTITNINNPTSTVTGLVGGTTYTFTWTVNNGPCSSSTDQMVLNYYNVNQPAADAGPNQSICQPLSSVVLAANAADSPATGMWTVISGPNAPTFTPDASSPNATLSNLTVGTYVLQWTIDNGACAVSETFDEVTIEVFDDEQTTADAGDDIELCEPVSDVLLTGNNIVPPATCMWTQISGPNTAIINNPNLSQVNVSALVVGCYVFRYTIDNGSCANAITFDEVQVCLYDSEQSQADAGLDQTLCSPTSSAVLAANSIISPAVGTWTVSGPNMPTFTPDINSPTATVSNLIIGTYTFTWSVDNGACFNANTSDEMVIEVFNTDDPVANAGDDQSICSPNDAVFMDANDPTSPAEGLWTIITGFGTIVDATDPNTEITNLPVGTNCFQWTTDNGGCGAGVTFDQVCIEVFSDNQLAADAGEDQDLCTPTSSTFLEGNALISPATGTWTQISGPAAVSFIDNTNPETEVTGLTAVGCYQFQWQIDNGVCANAITTDTVQVCVFNSGFDPAFAGDDIELCSPTSSTVLDATAAEAPGEGTWTADPGNPSVVTFAPDVNDPNATISGLVIGVYNFSWALNYAACGSEDDEVTVTVYNSAQGEALAGPDQQLCTPTSSTTLAADPVLPPGYGTWSVISGSVDFVDPNDPTTIAFNIQQGTNVLLWTVYNGDCLAEELTTDTMIIQLNDVNQPEAFAGDDQFICTPQSSVMLTGSLLIPPATGEWTTTSTATIVTPNDVTTDVTGLEVGMSTFCWTIDNGACDPPNTTDCVDIFVFDEDQSTADAGVDQELCSNLTDCADLNANPITFPAEGTWGVIGGPSVLVFSDVNDPQAQVCGLIPGVYTLEWCVDNGPCFAVTCNQMTITMFDDSAEPSDVGPDVELCTPDQSIITNANVVPLPGFGIWQVVSGSGVIDDTDNPQTEISSIPIGINQFSWCISNGVCPDANSCDTLTVSVFDQDAQAADAGPDQDWCEPTSCVTMAALMPTVPGTGTWTSLTPGPTIVDANDPFTEMCNLGVGEYFFLWTVYNGPCDVTNTTDLVRIRIFSDNQNEADAGEDISICSPQDVVTLNGNDPIFPATGVWDALVGANGTIVDQTNPDTQVIGLVPDSDGMSCFEWTIDNGPCIPSITMDTMCVFVYDSNIPEANAGEDQELCAPMDLSPVCATLTGSLIAGAATGLWTQDSGPTLAIFSNPTDPITDVCNLLVGCYEFRWTIDNGPCGSSTDIMQVCVFNPNDSVADAGPDAEYCTPVDVHTMNAANPTFPNSGVWLPLTSGLTYTDLSNPDETFSGLPVGINIFIWTLDNGACGQASDVMTVVIYNEFNPDANAGDDIELCLPTTEATLGAEAPFLPAVGQWLWVSGPCPDDVIITDVNNPNSLVMGLCEGTTCLQWGVDNGPCPNGITLDTMCIRVYDPTTVVLAGPDQFICTPTSQVNMAGSVPEDPNVGTWFNINGGGTIDFPADANTTISDLPVGINTFVWQFYNGVCANNLPLDTMSVFVYDQSQPPAQCIDDIELCFPETDAVLGGNAPVIPAIGFWTLVAGSGNIDNLFDPNSPVSNLTTGDNVFTWTIDNGPCIDSITVDTMVVHVFPENPQVANAGMDFELCTPEADVVLDATAPVAPSTAYWESISLNGILIDSLNANSDVISLTVGIHTLAWHVYNGPCDPEDVDQMSIVVYDATAPVADAGVDIEICSPLDSVQMAGSIVTFPGNGQWTLGAHPGNPAIVNPPDSATWITDLSIGITELIWTFDNGDCGTTSDTMLVSVFNPAQADASTGADEFICDPPASIDLVGNAATSPAYGWWEQIAGDSIAVIADTSANITTATNIALNETAFVWHIYNGACDNSHTTDTIWFFVNDSEVANADAGKDTTFCGEQALFQLNGSELVGTVQGPATGLWTALDSPSGSIMDENDPNTTLTNVPVGVHCFEWMVDNGACGVSADTMCITIYDPGHEVAYAGEDAEICSDQFSPYTLNANAVEFPAIGYWTITEGEIVLDDSLNNQASVIYLGSVSVPLVNEENWLTWTIDNGDCGTSTDSVLYVLLDCETIVIPDAFSPNADGTNDVFYIPNLEYYPLNNIQIFNRWGALVYQASPYKNDWDGTNTQSAMMGDELPTATYYYVLDLGEVYEQEQRSVFTGYVYLKR